ncbi:hypothetical protein BDV96DRAFT_606073 [Lophiotrema nucula]|uniref:Uncharacterized protein n=1 Tax=Lophiotrema nucula TaxID=690887 RepID=A0A6A5YPM6_9PLEO|nr:hypothetical protein BDV96DRAFT_606073 [Lophiotrema nucula]
MGARHQLFVIAKINGRYRGLAAVHNQFLLGADVLKTCQQLITIFGGTHNQKILQLELTRAKDLTEDEWQFRKTWEFGQSVGPHEQPFPFVATCLLLGTTVDFKTGEAYNRVSACRWNMAFDGGDNNEGVTILDITDVKNIRHCFAKWERVPQRLCLVPLTGEEYLSLYPHDPQEPERYLSTGLSLIDERSLEELWPRGWRSRSECGLDGGPRYEFDDELPKELSRDGTRGKGYHKSLAESSTEKVIERLLDQEDRHREEVEQLPHFVPALRDYLHRHPEVVSSKPFGYDMLSLALVGHNRLELSQYPDLSSRQVLDLARGACEILEILDISGNKNVTKDDMDTLFASRKIKVLYAWANPQLNLADLIEYISQGSLDRLYHPELYANVFRRAPLERTRNKDDWDKELPGETILPTDEPRIHQVLYVVASRDAYADEQLGRDSELLGAQCPAIQELLKSSKLKIAEVLNFCALPFRDIGLTPSLTSRILPTVIWALAGSFGISMGYYGSIWFDLHCWPCALAFRDHESPYSVHPIPSQLYHITDYNAPWMNDKEIQGLLKPLEKGERTLIMINEPRSTTGARKHRFRLALVTLGDDGAPHISDAKTFLSANDEGAVERWDSVLARMKSRVEVVDCDTATAKNVLGLMDWVLEKAPDA